MYPKFGKISEIKLDVKESWSDRLFLTIDIDWCCDDVLVETINLIEYSGVYATWFVTHKTHLLNRLRENPKFELGIHPNFNSLEGDLKNTNATEILNKILEVVPEAKSIRSHSLTQSSKLLQMFVDKGLTHDCNSFIPEQSGIELKPWKVWNGLIKVPHCWEDDLACQYGNNISLKPILLGKGLKVFDFHPIHIFLNTEHLSRYESTRSIHHHPNQLIQHKNKNTGIKNLLDTLLYVSND